MLGDLTTLAALEGYHGDMNETYVVGEVDDVSKQLIKITYEVRFYEKMRCHLLCVPEEACPKMSFILCRL